MLLEVITQRAQSRFESRVTSAGLGGAVNGVDVALNPPGDGGAPQSRSVTGDLRTSRTLRSFSRKKQEVEAAAAAAGAPAVGAAVLIGENQECGKFRRCPGRY